MLTGQVEELRNSLESSKDRLSEQFDENDKTAKSLTGRINELQQSLQSAHCELEK